MAFSYPASLDKDLHCSIILRSQNPVLNFDKNVKI